MAICKACGQEMTTAEGCTFKTIKLHDGRVLDRIPYNRLMADMGIALGERCRDCGAVDGNLHHPDCDLERCPKCWGQLITCGCVGQWFQEWQRPDDVGKESKGT